MAQRCGASRHNAGDAARGSFGFRGFRQGILRRSDRRNIDGHAGDETVRQSATGPGSHAPYIIDAGGDLLIRTGESAQPAPLAEGSGHDTGDTVTIALEDPANPGTEAIGIASIVDGAFCASAPSRRHWSEEAGRQLHHLLNAVDGRPVRDVAASWVYVPSAAGRPYPTALADGLATACFVTAPDELARAFDFECAAVHADRTAIMSRHFPGNFFTV